ncbi:hypothetical protein AK812_SmicGene4639 [Symbiodinium microadriaticum]|uniref:Reverse transcriptase domain-containing protein n=1 Tax=Symbiodinium microadriaticum TaxID=2951 RepID=A0A1Q9EVU9_SYMMI|nr:hypothetical protein AK812_SmicGene4639 [Symbiodinium microadriaticum]
MVDPRLTFGAPRQWLSLVKRVWLNQTRWIQYAGHTHETPTRVKRSIPQGDALSPLAQILLLAAPVKDVEAHEAACGLLQSNFVDDRAASCRTAVQAHRYTQRWTRWSAKFGFLENFDKMEVLTSEKHYGELRRLGFAAKCLKTAIRVLGVDLPARLQDVVRPTAEKRNEDGKAIAARLMRMPASLHVKRKLWPPTPAGELQCRFGWIQRHDEAYGTAVLRHLAAVRQAGTSVEKNEPSDNWFRRGQEENQVRNALTDLNALLVAGGTVGGDV